MSSERAGEDVPDHDHQWQDTGFATVEDCAVKGCDWTRSDGVIFPPRAGDVTTAGSRA